MIQATKWLGQLYDGTTKFTGGKLGDAEAINVGGVPTDQIKAFTISHNTFAHTFYDPTQKWYGLAAGVVYEYPQEYQLEDGSILTVDYDRVKKDLILIQQ